MRLARPFCKQIEVVGTFMGQPIFPFPRSQVKIELGLSPNAFLTPVCTVMDADGYMKPKETNYNHKLGVRYIQGLELVHFK